MANPIVTTIELQEENITNSSLYFLGSVIKNGWEVTAWGFWWYKTSSGVETKVYIASSSDLEGTDFLKFSTSKDPYTSYTFRARAYFRKWNTDTEEYDYYEGFGDWKDVTTHAYCTTLQIFACNINKATGAVTFHGDVNDNDEGNCVERGFQYGTSKTASYETHKNGDFAEEMFSLQVTVALNTDFYVRTYLKSASGHYAYTGEWCKFTTKVISQEIVVLSNAGYFPSNCEDYFRVFDENGQEENAYKLPVGHDTSKVTVDAEGNAYYGYASSGNYYVAKRKLSDGSLSGSWTVSAYPRGLCVGQNDSCIYVLENKTLYKRLKSNLAEISHITLNADYSYECGITVDIDGYVYVGRTYPTDRLYKYSFYPSYSIVGLVAYETHAITNIGFKYFEISGDYTSIFITGACVVVEGSANNNGTYTVSPAGSTCFGGITRVNVDEDVPSELADGTLRRDGVQGFKVADDFTSEFAGGATVIVKASTGNNGTYTVISGGATYASNYTTIRVNEAIPDLTEDGAIIQQEGGTLEASILSPVDSTFGNIAVSGDYVYMGSWFDVVAKAKKDLSSISSWTPSGTWGTNDWWFEVGTYKGYILIEGIPTDSYQRHIAMYDSDRVLMWKIGVVRGIKALGGCPFGKPVVTTQAPTLIDSMGQLYYKCAMGNGTIVSGSDITERGFEVKVHVDFFGVGPEIFWNLIGFYDEGEIVYHDFGQRTGYLIKRETWTGEFEIGVFEGVLGYEGISYSIFEDADHQFDDALEECTSYTYRAYATNDIGTGYGDWVAFNRRNS